MMTREDYEHLAELVADEQFTDPDSHEQRVWNMALKTAARQIRRAGLSVAWAVTAT